YHELDGAEHEQPQNDDRRADDPGRLDLGVAVDRLAVGVVTGPGPPDHDRVDEVQQDEDDDRGAGYGEHGDVELLMPGRVGHVARRQMGPPDEPDDQVGDQRQDQPDQEEPQAMAGTRGGLRGLVPRLDGLVPGRRRHELTTSISPIM